MNEDKRADGKGIFVQKKTGYIILPERDTIEPYHVELGGGSAYGGRYKPAKPEDERFVGKPGEIKITYAMALNVPDIDTDLGFMHTLFALEDIYGLKIDKLDDEVCIRLDKNRGTSYISLLERFSAWQKEAAKYRNGEISKEEYDRWRYTYPEVEAQRTRDALDVLKERKKDGEV